MGLTKGFNPPGSVGMGDLCAFLAAVGVHGIVIGDIDNAFMLSKLTQGITPPTVANSILYIENGKLVYGSAASFASGGTVTGTDIRPLSNNFTGVQNSFQGNIVIFGTTKVNLNALATANASAVVLDSNSILRTVPLLTGPSLLSGDNQWTGNNVFNQTLIPGGPINTFTVVVPASLNSSSLKLPQIPRAISQGVYILMLDGSGNVWKVAPSDIGLVGGGGGGILGTDNTFTGVNTFGSSVLLSLGLFSNGTINNQGPLIQSGSFTLQNLIENNNPSWTLTLNPTTSRIERTALERGTTSSVVVCANITVGYASTLSPSVPHASVPNTSMGDSLLPANTNFSPNGAGRPVIGKVYIPNVKVVAAGTTFFHIHVWANSALIASFVEPSNASVHSISFPFSFTGAQGANPIIIRFAVEYSTGASGVVTFNENDNAKYQPIVIFEEISQG